MNDMGRSNDFEVRQGSINMANVRVRLADYVARRIAEHGVRHVFMLTGGGAMHLNDALGRAEDLHYVCCHHEQRSEEHTSELQSLMRISYAVFCLQKKKKKINTH